MLGQFSGQEEPDGGLDLPGGDGGPLVVVGQAGRFSGNPGEDIVDKGVHNAHSFGRDASVRVDLLENLVDVYSVGLLPLSFPLLLVSLGYGFLGFARLLGGLSGDFGRHVSSVRYSL